MMHRAGARLRNALLVFVCTTNALADQQLAAIGDFTLDSGDVVKNCRVGYRTFGELNEQRSNVVIFPTWFGGTSADLAKHGKIGPGAIADSDRYFIITIDALGNGISCSPSNSKLESGKRFIALSTADMVRSQYRLLTEQLGIERVHAIIGISMGGMQTFRWVEMYPGFMDKAVIIDGSPKMTSYDLLQWHIHKDVIRTLQRNGASDAEIGSVISRLSFLTLFTPDYFVETISPEAIDGFLEPTYQPNAAFRADDYVSQLDAMMNHDVAATVPEIMAGREDVDILIIGTPSDQMVNPVPAKKLAQAIGADYVAIDSNCGHIGSSCENQRVTSEVAAFLK